MLGTGRIERGRGDPPADGHLEKVTAHRVGLKPGLDILTEPFRDDPRVELRRVGEDDGELVTAHATRHVRCAHMLADEITHRPEHPVPYPGAVGVVDLPELVEV